MTANKALYLHEDVMLLALHDRKGTVAAGSTYAFAVGGAVLAELMLQKRIDVESVKKNQYARILDPRTLGNPLLDLCLEKLVAAKKRAQLQTWVSRFSNMRNLKHLASGELVRRGILRIEKDQVLGIFTRTIYPELDPRPERELVSRLEKAIFTTGAPVDPRTSVLIALATRADLLKLVFDKKRLKNSRERIEQISKGDLAANATREALEAMRAAVMVACIMPAIMASSHHS